MGLWIPHELDGLRFPQVHTFDEHPIVVFRDWDGYSPKEKVRYFAKRLLREEAGAIPFANPVTLQHSMWSDWLGMTAAAVQAGTLTPAALGATTGRVFPFMMQSGMAVAKIQMLTPTATVTCMQIGIFDASSSAVANAGLYYNSGALGVTVTTTTISPTSFIIPGGEILLFCVTNNNSASANTAWNITPAYTAALHPWWGSFVCVAGAMPTSTGNVNTFITKTVGGFHCYTVLAEL